MVTAVVLDHRVDVARGALGTRHRLISEPSHRLFIRCRLVGRKERIGGGHHTISTEDAQALETLFLSAITVAELRAGLALLPAGKRRAGLEMGLEKRVLPLIG